MKSEFLFILKHGNEYFGSNPNIKSEYFCSFPNMKANFYSFSNIYSTNGGSILQGVLINQLKSEEGVSKVKFIENELSI